MSALTYRNRQGQVVDMPEFSATDAKNGFGRVLETVFSHGVVAITKRDEPKAVLLSLEAYEDLLGRQREPLQALSAEFDQLLAGLQQPAARQGWAEAFDASPDDLASAAIAAASSR
jgi:prevent-host-death family protein